MKIKITNKMARAFKVGTVLRETYEDGDPSLWAYVKTEEPDTWALRYSSGSADQGPTRTLAYHVEHNVETGRTLKIED